MDVESEYGEPWEDRNDMSIYTSAGTWLADVVFDDKERARLIACVNAMQGIENPQAFVDDAVSMGVPKAVRNDGGAIERRHKSSKESG